MLRRWQVTTSGLSTADLAVVDSTELNAAIRTDGMQQRARFPLQLIGLPHATALPLTDEERAAADPDGGRPPHVPECPSLAVPGVRGVPGSSGARPTHRRR